MTTGQWSVRGKLGGNLLLRGIEGSRGGMEGEDEKGSGGVVAGNGRWKGWRG